MSFWIHWLHLDWTMPGMGVSFISNDLLILIIHLQLLWVNCLVILFFGNFTLSIEHLPWLNYLVIFIIWQLPWALSNYLELTILWFYSWTNLPWGRHNPRALSAVQRLNNSVSIASLYQLYQLYQCINVSMYHCINADWTLEIKVEKHFTPILKI